MLDPENLNRTSARFPARMGEDRSLLNFLMNYGRKPGHYRQRPGGFNLDEQRQTTASNSARSMVVHWPFVILSLVIFCGQTPAHAQEPQQFRTPDELRAFEVRLRGIVQKVAPAVVRWRGEGPHARGGSGVVFDESGLILTHSHHGYKPGQQVTVHFPDRSVVPATLESSFKAQGGEWSVLAIDKVGRYPAAQLQLGDVPESGDWCFHLGYPAPHWAVELPTGVHRSPLLRLGRIIGASRYSIYASCLSNSGDSGGPLFDLEGRVIGIAVSSGKAPVTAGGWTGVPIAFNTNVLLHPPSRITNPMESGRKPIDTKYRGIDPSLFNQMIGAARRATVQVLIEGRPTVLGVVVADDGIILTKRAEILTTGGILVGNLPCRLASGDVLPARVIAESHRDDVALVQVDAELPTIPWSPSKRPEQGSLIATLGQEEQPFSIGVIASDHVFQVGGVPGYVGIGRHPDRKALENGARVGRLCIHLDHDGLRVQEHEEGMSGDCLAWDKIRSGDLITHVDGKPVRDLEDWMERTTERQSWFGGDLVQLTIKRGRDSRQVVFPLNPGVPLPEGYSTPFDAEGSLSLRMSGFPAVVAHDALLTRQNCGGPVVDLGGHVVAINIARYGREKTLAIPHDVAQALVDKMLAEKE